MKYHIATFGCQMNKSDSERIVAVLEKIGHEKTSEIKSADLIVINMCSVRQSAVDRVYGLAPKFKKLQTKNYKLKTLLTGCIIKQDLKKLKNNFDYVLPIKTLSQWPNILKAQDFCYYPDPRSPSFNQKLDADYLQAKPFYQNDFSAFVPVSTGCNNFCSYCVVPYARGPLICRPTKDILNEVRDLVSKEFKEIWLLGQNVNSYNSQGTSFPELLKTINNVSGDFWISFTSSHPKDFSDELIKTMVECEKISKYISLPIQAGDDEILKKMNRPHTVAHYKELVKKIRKAMPDVCLSTDVIVGFPGETKKQFENTVKLFEEIKFDMAYIAEYSPRPGTAAFKMKDNVPKKEKQRRREVLTKVLKKTAIGNNKKYIGKTVEVLVNEAKNDFIIGKTKTYKTVKTKGPPNLRGQLIQVKIIDVMPWGLKGVL